eukprot:TRINITY_DN39590_c0_g2_i1.p1 TRINITY_DN39590_c0_g2~~TRINITY_DN39590_c0_g2_i1.p1  ORF type:complete len:3352 (-),score=690.22 TRINITY_DN39590_c0_g2_i1:85-9075(-)
MDRRYKLTAPAGFVQNSAGQIGPLAYYSFEVDVGAVKMAAEEPLLLLDQFPLSGSLQVQGQVDIVVDFDVPVQRGIGDVKICTGFTKLGTCIPVLFVDGTDASEAASMSIHIDRRRVRLSFTKELRGSQVIHVAMEQGAFVDAARGVRQSPQLADTDYVFSVQDRDMVKPFLVHYEAPKRVTDPFVLIFSEAVRLGPRPVKMTTEAFFGAPQEIADLSIEINGNVVTVRKTWDMNVRYQLQELTNALTDVAGNVVAGDIYRGTNLKFQFQEIPDPGPRNETCRRLRDLSIEPSLDEDNATTNASGNESEVELNFSNASEVNISSGNATGIDEVTMLNETMFSETSINETILNVSSIDTIIVSEDIVAFSFTVSGVDYTSLAANMTLVERFKATLKKGIADESGGLVQPDDVTVHLSAGSIKVDVFIAPEVEPTAVSSALASSQSLTTSLAAHVAAIPGIDAAATGEIAVTAVSAIRISSAEDEVNTPTTSTTRTTSSTTTSTSTSTTTTTTTVEEECETRPPVLTSMYPPEGASDIPPESEFIFVGLFFNKEVRLLDDAVISFKDSSGTVTLAEDMSPKLIEGNGVLVTVPGSVLESGITFLVSIPDNAIIDRAGNAAAAVQKPLSCDTGHLSIKPSSVNFVVSMAEDTTAPTGALYPASGRSDVHRKNIFYLDFDEEVVAASGKVHIFGADVSGCQVAGCTDDYLAAEADIKDLPLVSHVNVSAGRRTSRLIIDMLDSLSPEYKFRVVIPPGAVTDLAGNAYAGIDKSAYSITATVQKDDEPPTVIAVELGSSGSPDGAFAQDEITVYFSEDVQMGVVGNSLLMPSSGSNLCSLNDAGDAPATTPPGLPVPGPAGPESLLAFLDKLPRGICESGLECKSPCGYRPAATSRILSPRSIQGSKVVLAGALLLLEASAGYKLVIEGGAFQDLHGNSNVAFDGEVADIGVVLRAAASPSSRLPAVASWPSSEALLVPPSTSLQIVYSDDVRAGPGSIIIGDQTLAARDCYFTAGSMSCLLPELLGRAESYTGYTTSDAVVGLLGQSTQPVTWSFTTIDADYSPPALLDIAAVSGGSRSAALSTSALLTLSFSEVVRARSGVLLISDCSPGDPDLCFDGEAEMEPDIDFLKADVQSEQVYVDGTVVYIDHRDFTPGRRYVLEVQGSGVFEDIAGNLLEPHDAKMEFSVFLDDQSSPALYQQVPGVETTAAPNADIIFYFSEAVQAGTPIREITVTDGEIRSVIPLDNSLPSQGRVSIDGSIVTIDPFRDMGYDRTVTVRVPTGAFTDLAGQPFAGIFGSSYRFKTMSYDFLQLHPGNATGSFTPREGAAMHQVGSSLVLFGGMSGNKCLEDAWTSESGTSWSRREFDSNLSRPLAAYSATAVDRNSCIWLLGGQCSRDSGVFWKSCDGATTWTQLPRPTSVPKGLIVPQRFPSRFQGHAMAFLSGWQLVLVDAGRLTDVPEDVRRAQNDRLAGVWTFLDAAATVARQVLTEPLPFGYRWHPSMVASSDAQVYLVGGHRCSNIECTSGRVLTDIWVSANGGETWRCLNVNWGVASPVFHAGGGERYTTAVATLDDTVFVLGGGSQTGQDANAVFVSSPAALDVVYDSVPYLQFPAGSQVTRVNMTHAIYFPENVQKAKGGIQITNLGQYDAQFNVYNAPDDAAVDFDMVIRGQAVLLTPKGLQPGHGYRVDVPAGALQDEAGNLLEVGLQAANFFVEYDIAAPAVVSALPLGADASRHSTVTLTFSEPIYAGAGTLALVPGVGRQLQLPVGAASILDNKVVFALQRGEALTAGQTYKITVPEGLLIDAAGNAVAAGVVGTFSVLSGSEPSESYEPGAVLPAAAWSGNSTKEQLQVVMIQPANGASDVPAEESTVIKFYFSDIVQLGAVGVIRFSNSTSSFVAGIDLSNGRAVGASGNVSEGALVEVLQDGRVLQVAVPPHRETGDLLLKAGSRYGVEIPAGVLQDKAGSPLPTISTSFTCLSEKADTTAPTFVATSPYIGQLNVRGSSSVLQVYFSEPVVAGSGAITLMHLSNRVPPLLLDVGDPKVNISGAILSLNIGREALNAGGHFALQVPVGSVRDSSGNPFAGINGSTFWFTAASGDVVSPRLVGWMPPHEAAPQYQLPESSALLLTFSEPVQAGPPGPDSIVTLTPTYGTMPVTLTQKEMVFADDKVMLIPPDGLAAGEYYTVTIGATAFMDLESNYFEEQDEEWYKFSVAPALNFSKFGGNHWSKDGETGRRLGLSAAVGAGNRVFVAGGRRAATEAAEEKPATAAALLNDVWVLNTGRETHCAAGPTVPTSCSSDVCRLTADGKATLGERDASVVVWRAPSDNGKPCHATETGEPLWKVGAIVQAQMEECPCPLCATPPEGDLPDHMLNTEYIKSYVLVSAMEDSRPLLCEDGYAATGGFKCVVDSPYVGKFQTPYPACREAPCAERPNTSAVEHFGSLLDENCLNLGEADSEPIPHSGSCRMSCQPGWEGTGDFKCSKGKFSAPTCAKQYCNATQALEENIVADCGADGEVVLGMSCTATCDAGFHLYSWAPGATAPTKEPAGAEVRLNCSNISSAQQSQPYLHYPAEEGRIECVRADCGDLREGRIDTAHGTETYRAGTLLGDEVTVQCAPGFLPANDAIVCGPRIDQAGRPEAMWQNSSGKTVTQLCRPLQCRWPMDPHGKYWHQSGSKANQRWKLECDPGYTLADKNDHTATCSETEVAIQPKPCVYIGGCNSSLVKTYGLAVEGTTCKGWVAEDSECTVTCANGYEPVGKYTCSIMDFLGTPTCVPSGSNTMVIDKVAGAYVLEASLPEGTAVESNRFEEVFRNAFSESVGVWPTSLARFDVRLMKQDETMPRPDLSALRRRLASIVARLELAYEIFVENEDRIEEIHKELDVLGSTSSSKQVNFMLALLQNGIQVRSMRVMRPPKTFRDTIVEPPVGKDDQSSLPGSSIRHITVDDRSSTNTVTILTAFIGALFLILFIGFCIITVSARQQKLRVDVKRKSQMMAQV